MSLSVHGAGVADRLAHADLELRPGELTAICGPNGAGKSTLLAVLAGLLAPGEGKARLDGRDMRSLPAQERAQAIGYLPQSREVAWNIDVATLASLGRLPWRSSANDDAAAVLAALRALDLDDLALRPVSRLSGGELARALLARVLAGTPRWVLADEPLAALDLAHQAALIAHFRALANQGLGIVAVLHDLTLAMNATDRVIVLERGAIVADGPPGEVLTAARLRETWGIEAEWVRGAAGLGLVVCQTSA